MLRKSWTAFILIAVCAIGAAAQQTVTIGDTSDDSQTVQQVGDMTNNRQTTLEVGDTLAVKLSNNTGTGYQWYLDANNNSLLRLDNGRTQNGGLLGGRNQQMFYFVAVAPGSDKLSFVERRIVGRQSYTGESFRTLVTINRARPGKTVTVTEDNDRGSIRIRQGDSLVLKLKNNAGTAYRWGIAQNDPGLLQPVGKDGMITKLTNLLGGSTYQTFTFGTPNSGKVKLKLLLQNQGFGNRFRVADSFEILVQIDRS